MDDNTLNCQSQLIDYMSDESVHSVLLLTFSEVLWYVLQTINKDFTVDVQSEIKKILNHEIHDSLCKCFTGRIVRLINCLNGFSPLVSIQIRDSEQISNLLFMIKDQLGSNYSVEKHKELLTEALKEREYDESTINDWVSYIE